MKKIFTTWQLWAGIAIALVFLLIAGGRNVTAILPFGLLLLCPLMMMSMHGGHSDHKDNKKEGGHHHG